MNIRATNIMDRSRHDLEEIAVHSAGGSTAANTCSNVPLDNALAVAMETTPNPPSYWPPHSLPTANAFKETVVDPQIRTLDGPLTPAVPPADSKPDGAAPGPGPEIWAPKNGDDVHLDRSLSSGRALQHNLPPIAGITSSHNYRGASKVGRANGLGPRPEPEDSGDGRTLPIRPDKNPVDSGGPSEPGISEVSPMDRTKVGNSEYSFQVPRAHPKQVPATRAPTPFVSAPGCNAKVPGDVDRGFGSSSPSSGPMQSTYFVATSTTGDAVTSSDSSRGLPSPRPATSNLKVPGAPTEGSYRPQLLPNSPQACSQRPGSSYLPNSHSPNLNNSNLSNASLRCVQPDSSRPRSYHESSEDKRQTPNTPNQQPSALNQSSRFDVSQANRSSILLNAKVSHPNGPSADDQSNSFEVPSSKSYGHKQVHVQHHNHQLHHQYQVQSHQQQKQESAYPFGGGYPNAVRSSADPAPIPRSHHHRTPETERHGFFPLKMNEPERTPVEPTYNSVGRSASASHGLSSRLSEYSQSHGAEDSSQRPKYLTGDAVSRHSSKDVEVLCAKSGGNGAGSWTKVETNGSDVGSPGRGTYKGRTTDPSYQDQGKYDFRAMKGHFRLTVDKKEGANFGSAPPGTSTRLRYPPVPQSNYDLNGQIYDTMTGRGNLLFPPKSHFRPVEKSCQPFPSPKTQMADGGSGGPTLRQPHHPDASDKTCNLSEASAMKRLDYPGQDLRMNSYVAFHQGVVEGPSHGGSFQGKKLSSPGQYPTHVHGQQSVVLESHRTPTPRLVPGHHQILSQAGQTHAAEKGRSPMTGKPPVQATATSAAAAAAAPERLNSMAYGQKKLAEEKTREMAGQSLAPQPIDLLPGPLKVNVGPPGPPGPCRSKRESPLDLSVKTVRQSADSTAKDDCEVYFQSYKNLSHGAQASCHSESRFPISIPQLGDASTGAPKIDFTPNFSGFHLEAPRPSSTPLHQKPESSVLPPVESFKKFPGRLLVPEVNAKCEFSSSTLSSSSSSSSSVYYHQAGSNPSPVVTDHQMTGRHLQTSDRLKPEAQKRPSNSLLRNHSSQPKIPKIDSWKLAFDEQLEQRLNSARANLYGQGQNAEFGVGGSGRGVATKATTSEYQSNPSRHSGGMCGPNKNANLYPQIPVQTSATPQTPQERVDTQVDAVGHSPDPEQIIKQISKGVMPDYKLLQDKNVLSILRSSLEEKEAKLMQLREAARRKERYKDLVVGTSDVAGKKMPEPRFKGHVQDRPSLPSFGALALERMCVPPSFPGHRLPATKSIESIKIDIEPVQKYRGKGEAEKGGIPRAEFSPHADAQGPPADLDGLAAFLAARIRTKGELKQVGPELAGSLPEGQSQPVAVTSTEEFSDKGLATCPTMKSPNFLTGGHPPKLVRETRLMTPLRRRLFSHADEDAPTTSSQKRDSPAMPPRDPNGIRSSSETSVFDFRESDSEGEMPVLERQTLEEMRRDRRTFGSKQNVSVVPADEVPDANKSEVIAELDKNHPDPFWDTAFDMFVEQLEKRPPKRSVRRRNACSRGPYGGPGERKSGKRKHGPGDNENESTGCAMSDEEDEDEEELVDETKRSAEGAKEIKQELKVEEVKGEKPREDEKLDVGGVREDKREQFDGERSRKCLTKPSQEQERRKTKEFQVDGKDTGKTTSRLKSGGKARGKAPVEQRASSTDSDRKDAGTEINSDEDEDEDEGYDVDNDEDDEEDDDDDDDDESLSLSGLESESTESEESSESSNSSYSSEDDSDNEGASRKRRRMQTRLQTRSSKQKQVKNTGMRLRSKAALRPATTAPGTTATTATSNAKSKKRLRRRRRRRRRRRKTEEYYACGKRKKPAFGDGSHFRPGWEEECYKFKQQLRMPEKLISISIPQKRPSASLPDLDPYRNSPSLDGFDMSATKKTERKKEDDSEDDSESADSGKPKCARTGPTDGLTTLKSRNGKKTQSSSILNLLVKKYGGGRNGRMGKKERELRSANDRKSPRILPKATNKPELLPTPSLGIGKENVLTNKKRGQKDAGKKKPEEESHYLGYFRKKTVNNFKEAFKQNVGLLAQEFSPTVLKSRTRTQTRDLKKKATLIEVFGEERPASAPPEVNTETDKAAGRKKGKSLKKSGSGVVTRGRGKLVRSGRPGLRSTAVLRSNKAVQISKRHLNGGRKRNSIDLLRMRAMASKKFSYLVTSSETSGQLPITKKRLKLRSVRRKFRSGFDYIRKKKKLKKDGDSVDGSVKERKLPVRSTSESVEDIQNEIKNWVINKGLGETILHRAARLGYTDVAAYCLEKLNCSPSPRDNAGYTPLHEACSRGHLDIAKLLLMYGASVSESAKGGIRPLHEAAENGFTELIRLLLSFGADPLLETYTGHTALSLVSDEEARRLLQHHLADVQGNVAPVWTFQGPSSVFDPLESGCDPLVDPPSPPPDSRLSDCELEVSDSLLPPLYRLTTDRDSDRVWVLLRDLLAFSRTKASKETLLKQVESSGGLREMKLSEFHEQSKCCNLLNVPDRAPAKSGKIALVPYDDKIRRLLDVERVVL